MLADLAKKLLYGSGALGWYHRVRNANTLTVAMFHRILPSDDPRWPSCDPDYTLSTELLSRSLQFFKRHYHVVSLAQVLALRRRGERLPPRALLISFDDGWSDNAEYALPLLQRENLPAVMFVVSDAVGTRQPFYQERMVSAWRRGTLRVAELTAALTQVGDATTQPGGEGIEALRAAIARIEHLSVAARDALLAPLARALDDGQRHMVDVAELERLRAGGVALGLHGKSHVHLTRAADLDAELSGARDALAALLDDAAGRAESMSFPHGAHDRVIAQRAHDAGYELVFTSVPVLNPVGADVGWLLGRTGLDHDAIVDASGRFRPDRLALSLFRRAHQRLI